MFAANILLMDGVVKITDFGLAKQMEGSQESMELTSQVMQHAILHQFSIPS